MIIMRLAALTRYSGVLATQKWETVVMGSLERIVAANQNPEGEQKQKNDDNQCVEGQVHLRRWDGHTTFF